MEVDKVQVMTGREAWEPERYVLVGRSYPPFAGVFAAGRPCLVWDAVSGMAVAWVEDDNGGRGFATPADAIAAAPGADVRIAYEARPRPALDGVRHNGADRHSHDNPTYAAARREARGDGDARRERQEQQVQQQINGTKDMKDTEKEQTTTAVAGIPSGTAIGSEALASVLGIKAKQVLMHTKDLAPALLGRAGRMGIYDTAKAAEIWRGLEEARRSDDARRGRILTARAAKAEKRARELESKAAWRGEVTALLGELLNEVRALRERAEGRA